MTEPKRTGTFRDLLLFLVVGGIYVAGSVAACSPAQASPTSSGTVISAAHESQTEAYAALASWSQSIGTTVERIGSVEALVTDGGLVDDAAVLVDGGGAIEAQYQEVRCQNLSTIPVYIGHTTISDTRQRYPICTDTAVCADKVITLPVPNARAVIAPDDAGDPEIDCIAVR